MGQTYRQKQQTIWENIINQLFPYGATRLAYWSDPQAIAATLNELGKKDLTMMLIKPEGQDTAGWHDLTGAKLSPKAKFVELVTDNQPLQVQPKYLQFARPDPERPQFDYFILQLGVIDPTKGLEHLLELKRETYIPDDGSQENQLLRNARQLARLNKAGPIIIFSKASEYNRTEWNAVYDLMADLNFSLERDKQAILRIQP